MIFLDFEASSWGAGSHPIQVAWCSHDLQRGWSGLIRPALGWTDWSEGAEQVHGIARARLDADGIPVEDVMARLVADQSDATTISDKPEFDQKWLAKLADGAGIAATFSVESGGPDACYPARPRESADG